MGVFFSDEAQTRAAHVINFTSLSYTTTGNSSILATYKSNNSSGGRPFALINPTATDSNQLDTGLSGSRINIWEILL